MSNKNLQILLVAAAVLLIGHFYLAHWSKKVAAVTDGTGGTVTTNPDGSTTTGNTTGSTTGTNTGNNGSGTTTTGTNTGGTYNPNVDASKAPGGINGI